MSKIIIDKELKAESVLNELSINCTSEEYTKKFMNNYPDDVSRVKEMFISQGISGLKLEYRIFDYFEGTYKFAKRRFSEKQYTTQKIKADNERFVKIYSNSELLYYLSDKKLLHHIFRVVTAKHDNNIKVFYFYRIPEVMNHVEEYQNNQRKVRII